MKNHLVGIAFCDGEIFSNLHFTQALYDALKGDINAPISDILIQANTVSKELINSEPVRKKKIVFDADLEELVGEVNAIYQNEDSLTEVITALSEQTKSYASTFGALKKGKKVKG